LFEVDMYVTAV